MEDSMSVEQHKPNWLLHRFPIDILAIITSFAGGFAIGRLLLSGDKQFSSKLGDYGGIPSFEIEGEVGTTLPPSSFLSRLPKLRRLHIDIVGNVKQESLTSLIPSKLPAGLVKIVFKFKWAEWIWKSLSTHRMVDSSMVFASPLEEEAYKELQVAKMFPCLEIMALEGWPSLRDPFVLVLPNLTHFALYSNPFLTQHCVSYLPSHLISLLLPEARDWPISAFELLPPSLTCLDWGHSQHLSSSVFSALPRSLESLTLGIIHVSNDDISNLPPTLQKLDLTIDASHTMSPGFQLLPSGLLHLKCTFFQTRLVTDASLVDLPRNLNILHLNSKVITTNGFSSLPPKLTQFTLLEAKNLSSKIFDAMPTSITSLSIPSCWAIGQHDVPASRNNLKLKSAATP